MLRALNQNFNTIPPSAHMDAMAHLITTIQDLSHAREIDAIAAIVRDAARNLTGADGATFILRDGDQCYYADENAIGPLWKGQRFPMAACASGWVMLNKQGLVIEDIYQDPRIPIDAYRPTFVKSMAMVPIRRNAPIGAIGNYWATHHQPSDEEMNILQALADTTSVALENAQLYSDLQQQLQSLQETNYELNRFAWVASHDLQEPLRTIVTQVELLQRRYSDKLDKRGIHYIENVAAGAGRLQHLIDDMLVHSRAKKIEHFKPLAIGAVVQEVLKDLDTTIRKHGAAVQVGEMPWVWGDHSLLVRLFLNLLTNAIKFQPKGNAPRIRISAECVENQWRFCVSDNGIGIEKEFLVRVFGLFQRLHSQDIYAGSGIGLATAKKIVELHDGKIWIESEPGHGTQVYIELPVANALEETITRIRK